VTGTGRAVTVTNVTTGDFVATQAVVPSGRTLVVDMALERATVNGSDVFVTDDSDFFRCKGRQSLLVANGAAQVEWSERWL
jgi:hypothetical protein